MFDKIKCCGGPISFYSASLFFSIYIMFINFLQGGACVVHLFVKSRSYYDDTHFIHGNMWALVTCCILFISGVLIFVSSLLRNKSILFWTTGVFLPMVGIRFILTVFVFVYEKSWSRFFGELFSIVVQFYASIVFCHFYREIKRSKSVARAEPPEEQNEVL